MNDFMNIFIFQNEISLFIDDFTLLTQYIIIFQKCFTNIKVVSFNVETSSFQFTSLQTLRIKADLPCDPRLSTYFLEVMLSALIRHQDLRVLLWDDKLGNQTITPFGLHWDLPEQEHLSSIPLWPVIVSIWWPLLRILTWLTHSSWKIGLCEEPDCFRLWLLRVQ